MWQGKQKSKKSVLHYIEALFMELHKKFLSKKIIRSSIADLDKVRRVWSDNAQDKIMQQRKFVAWMNHPYIEHYYLNQRLTGNVEENWLIYFKKKYIPQQLQIGLTLGCGEGSLERNAIQIEVC